MGCTWRGGGEEGADHQKRGGWVHHNMAVFRKERRPYGSQSGRSCATQCTTHNNTVHNTTRNAHRSAHKRHTRTAHNAHKAQRTHGTTHNFNNVQCVHNAHNAQHTHTRRLTPNITHTHAHSDTGGNKHIETVPECDSLGLELGSCVGERVSERVCVC